MADVNWAEVIRESLADRLKLEEELRRPIDRRKAIRGARGMDRMRARMSSGTFDSTTEVRRWRDSLR